MKHSHFIYFSRYKIVDKDYRLQKDKMVTSTLKSWNHKKMEMSWCKKYWHCSPVHYVRYALYDKQLSKDELLDYIPAFHFYNEYMERQLKGVSKNLYGNKLNLYYIFKSSGIPTPQVLAVVNHGILKDLEGNLITAEVLGYRINRGKKYFFKYYGRARWNGH